MTVRIHSFTFKDLDIKFFVVNIGIDRFVDNSKNFAVTKVNIIGNIKESRDLPHIEQLDLVTRGVNLYKERQLA